MIHALTAPRSSARISPDIRNGENCLAPRVLIAMKRIVLAQLIFVLAPVLALAQRNDVCHVYVVDVEKARKAVETFHETGNAEADKKALSVGETVFPEFQPKIGEEELTTRTYSFPGSNLTITASVYYTDESMASAGGRDSMLIGIVASPQAQKDALAAENNAVAEMTYNSSSDTVRAKKYLKVNGRLFLIGIECRCKEKPKPK